MESVVRLEPIDTIKHGISSAAGIQCSIVAFFLFGIIAGLIIWRGSGKESYDERNFEISQKVVIQRRFKALRNFLKQRNGGKRNLK